MSNLIMLAVCLIFAYIGYRKTWYPGWACLFNLLIAVYAGIMLTPQIVDNIPFVRNNFGSFSYAVFALFAAVVIFTVLELFSFRFFTSASTVPFPKILDSLGATVLGFLTGFIIAGFLLYVITITPLSKHSFVKSVVQGRGAGSCGNYAVITSCSFVHHISLQPIPDAVDRQFEQIMNKWDSPVEKPADANIPADSNTVVPPSPAGDD